MMNQLPNHIRRKGTANKSSSRNDELINRGREQHQHARVVAESQRQIANRSEYQPRRAASGSSRRETCGGGRSNVTRYQPDDSGDIDLRKSASGPSREDRRKEKKWRKKEERILEQRGGPVAATGKLQRYGHERNNGDGEAATVGSKRKRDEPARDRRRTTSSNGDSAAVGTRRTPASAPGSSPPDISSLEQAQLLHAHLRGFLAAISPTREDIETKAAVIATLRSVLAPAGLHAELFGSTRTGLSLPGADLDFFVCEKGEWQALKQGGCDGSESPTGGRSRSPTPPPFPAAMFGGRRQRQRQESGSVHAVCNILRRSGGEFCHFTKIAHARVPIVKCTHRTTQMPVDIGFAADGLHTTQYLIEKLGDSSLASKPTSPVTPVAPSSALGSDIAKRHGRPLIVVFKYLLSLWDLNDASRATLGSFAASLLCIFFLQTEVAQYPSGIADNFFLVLLGFLHFCSDFDFLRNGINVTSRKTFTKPPVAQLYITNPLDTAKNAASACTRFGDIQTRMKAVYNDLNAILHDTTDYRLAVRGFERALGLAAGMPGDSLLSAYRTHARRECEVELAANQFGGSRAKGADSDDEDGDIVVLPQSVARSESPVLMRTPGPATPDPSASARSYWTPERIFVGNILPN